MQTIEDAITGAGIQILHQKDVENILKKHIDNYNPTIKAV